VSDLHFTLTLQQTLRPGYAFSPLVPAASDALPPETPARQGVVSGRTESRLDQVRGYNNSQPYVVGERGVIALTDEIVSYVLDEITYHTRLDDGTTTYEFGFVEPAGVFPAQWGTETLPAHAPARVDDQLNPERIEGPLLTVFYTLGRAHTLPDLPVGL
jgi:hypothetical protein